MVEKRKTTPRSAAFNQAVEAVHAERMYQDQRHPKNTPGIGDHVDLTLEYAAKASRYVRDGLEKEAKDCLREVAALAIRGMEQAGIVERKTD